VSFRHIVRIADVDIDGEMPLEYGLAKIKGVGPRIAHACIVALGLDPHMRIGYLSDEMWVG